MTLMINEELKLPENPSSVPAITNDQLIENISQILTEILFETKKLLDQKQTCFDAKTVPSVSIKDYLKRLVKFTYCSQESVINALICLDRIFHLNIGIVLHDKNLHRFLIKLMENSNFYVQDFSLWP